MSSSDFGHHAELKGIYFFLTGRAIYLITITF